MWEIREYSEELKNEWDGFVMKSRNSTFLFMRGYMDYHSDRFADHSLMAYRKGQLAAVLPANMAARVLYSHQGLTYGGWILAPDGLDSTEIFQLWRSWIEYCRQQEIEKIVYKPLPYIYSLRPSQEDIYMLFLSRADVIRTDISSAIDLQHNPGFNKLQRRHLKKNVGKFKSKILSAWETEKIQEYHKMLTDCLDARHAATPVHSVEELELLITRFPDNIRLWTIYEKEGSEMQAGVVAFITPVCVHCQYIATTEKGRTHDILASLFEEMVAYYGEKGFRYFDFGISNEDGGRLLNPGLNRQKTSYGGSGVAYTRYEFRVNEALVTFPKSLWK